MAILLLHPAQSGFNGNWRLSLPQSQDQQVYKPRWSWTSWMVEGREEKFSSQITYVWLHHFRRGQISRYSSRLVLCIWSCKGLCFYAGLFIKILKSLIKTKWDSQCLAFKPSENFVWEYIVGGVDIVCLWCARFASEVISTSSVATSTSSTAANKSCNYFTAIWLSFSWQSVTVAAVKLQFFV